MKPDQLEALIIKGVAIRERLKDMESAFKEHFVEPLRKFMLDRELYELTAMDKGKVKLSFRKAKVDEDAVMEELRYLVTSGEVTSNELLELLMSGALGVGDADALAKKLKEKTGGDYYKVLDFTGSLRFGGVNKGDVIRIMSSFTVFEKCAEMIKDHAGEPLPNWEQKLIKGEAEF